jgi:hypothetical protein
MDWHAVDYTSYLQQDSNWTSALLKPNAAQDLNTRLEPEWEAAILLDTPDFEYSSLAEKRREIRILYLHASVTAITANGPERVASGILRHVSLDDKPTFVALSYVWGSSAGTFPILINGRVFHISANLHCVLEQLQNAEYILPIWIDAICINQRDNEEKSHQVQQMGDIYRAACLVVGWLGPAADSSDMALKTLNYLGEQTLLMPDGSAMPERRELISRIIPCDASTPNLMFPVAAVVALFSRPWWQRIWVVQEVVLARNVYVLCGDMDIPFYHVVLAFTALFELPFLNAWSGGALATRIAPLTPIFNLDPRLVQSAIRGHNQDPQPLIQRINEVHSMQATEAKDHIYALLGMVSDVDQLAIKVDYSKSCVEIFTQVAEGFLKEQGRLQILSRCQVRKPTLGLPSWVPDWSQAQHSTIWNSKHSLYRAGGSGILENLSVIIPGGYYTLSGLAFSITVKDKILTLPGVMGSTLHVLGRSWDDEELSDDDEVLSEYLADIETFARAHCHGYAADQELEAAIYRTPILDSELSVHPTRGRLNTRATSAARQAFYVLKSKRDLSDNNNVTKEEEVNRNQLFSYRAIMLAVLRGRQIFATSCGHLGLGPLSMKPGDSICAFKGAEVPFILREQEGGVGRYRRTLWRKERRSCELVGECYIHGFMDGEMWVESPRSIDFSLV